MIGITLLSILGLLVLIILVVLFVPVRYSLYVEADQSVNVRACVSWLLHLVHAKAEYDGAFGIVIRIFGIPVKRLPAPEEDSGKKNAKQKKKKRTRDEKTAQEQEGSGNGAKPENGAKTEKGDMACPAEDDAVTLSETVPADGQGAEEDKDSGEKPDGGAGEAGNSGLNADDCADEENKNQEKLSFFQKAAGFFRNIARFFGAVRAFFSKILYTIRNICGKIEKIREQIDYYLEVLRSEEGQRTFALVKRELGRLFRHIAPTKLTGSMTIGMDDPAVTGQIIAIVSMFYPIYGNNVSITPDFDEKCMRGRLYLKGRIRVITLIRIAWRVYFNKDMKKFLHMLKREENEA